jgi:hypothetical protein
VASIIDEKHRSLLMLESSMKVFFRGVNRRKAAQFRMGKAETESLMLDNEEVLFGQWGEYPKLCYPKLSDC